MKDQVRLTSWQGGSGRLEEGRSPAQAAWQAASAQQHSQAGLEDSGSRRQEAPGSRPRPLPRASARARGSISVPLWPTGRRKGSLPGWARSGSRAARAARSTRRSLAPGSSAC